MPIITEKIKSPEINAPTYGQLIYDKGGHREKTVSSISGAGNTGQQYVLSVMPQLGCLTIRGWLDKQLEKQQESPL